MSSDERSDPNENNGENGKRKEESTSSERQQNTSKKRNSTSAPEPNEERQTTSDGNANVRQLSSSHRIILPPEQDGKTMVSDLEHNLNSDSKTAQGKIQGSSPSTDNTPGITSDLIFDEKTPGTTSDNQANTVDNRPVESTSGFDGIGTTSSLKEQVPSRAIVLTPLSSSKGISTEIRSPSVSIRQCWICYGNDEDDVGSTWVQPCNCIGSTKWVHQSCLQTWVDEKLKERKDKKVGCPQCKTEYLLFVPKANLLVIALDHIDDAIYRICPFVVAGVLVGTLYWNMVTYGALVVFQISGEETFTESTDELGTSASLVALPLIPLILIVYRLAEWEDAFLEFLRTVTYCLPPCRLFLPSYVFNESGVVQMTPSTSGASFTRIIVGAFLTPTISQICGYLFFRGIPSPIQRAFAGGAAFVVVKGLIKMFYKQRTYRRLCKRKILDYTEENRSLMEASRVGEPTRVVASRHPVDLPT